MQFKLTLDEIQAAPDVVLQKTVQDLSAALTSFRSYLTTYPEEDPEAIKEFNFQICQLSTMRKAINLVLIERSLATQSQAKTIYAAGRHSA
jgi:hypothetical protein